MRVPCSKCNATTTIRSRPQNAQGRDAGGVYWKVYAVCSQCGTTSVYDFYGRPLITPEGWQPDDKTNTDIKVLA